MLPKPLRVIWGNLTVKELEQFGILAFALMFTVGPYWMLRGVREALFIDLVGVHWQPVGKIVSFLFVIPIVLIYSKLVDLFRKEKLFNVIYPMYGALFLMIALFVSSPNFLLQLTTTSPLLSWIPGKLFGWISYVIFESFGALGPALFWSFVVSYTTTSSAKRGYGMILSITQIGTISGCFFVNNFSQKLGLPMIIVIATAFILMVPLVIRLFLSIKGGEKAESPSFLRTNKPKTGFWEGLRLLIKQPYLLGIFIITTGYEIMGAFFEYQMNVLAHKAYPTKEMFAEFYALYGIFTNGLTLAFAVLGTSFFLRNFGLRKCLLIFPGMTAIVIIGARFFPILPVMLVSMIILKCLSYSLNNPSKEILYIPTSRDVKFKAKGWIDIFGIRSIKASGAGINTFLRKLAPVEAIAYATPLLLALVSGWLFIARIIGKKHHKLIEEGKIIK